VIQYYKKCVQAARNISRISGFIEAGMEMAVVCVIAPCNLVEVTDVSEVLAASIIRAIITLMMEAASTSEMSVNLQQTIQSYNPNDSHLYAQNTFVSCMQFMG
jgi:hypothetical protein